MELCRCPPTTKKLAPKVGLEPTTRRLTADCSTIELLWNSRNGKLQMPAPIVNRFSADGLFFQCLMEALCSAESSSFGRAKSRPAMHPFEKKWGIQY